MKMKGLFSILVLLAISLIIILSSLSVSPAKIEDSYITISDPPESHLIEGVPYISQENNFFCSFAYATMKFKHYGINTTLQEVVYYSGVGHSLIYPSLKNNRLPYTGWAISQAPMTFKFISDLFGLSYKTWKTDLNLSYEERWNEDWLKIKQNISNDVPIIFTLDVIILATDNMGFGVLFPLIKTIPFIAEHSILLLGYNEDNQTVCYSDPAYGIVNKSQYGTYRWVDLTKFKTSTRRYSERLFVRLFIDTPEPPLPIEESFRRAHKRNIEKLKGNISAYFDEDTSDIYKENLSFGINATKRLKRDLEKGLDYRIKTVYRYQLNNRLGIMYRLMNNLHNRHPQLFPFNLEKLSLEDNDAYGNIALEKKYSAMYLRQVQNQLTDENLSEICIYEAELLENEAENWSKFADCYSEFRKKGIFMSLPRALLLMNKMVDTMDNIISIEESIIAGPEEN